MMTISKRTLLAMGMLFVLGAVVKGQTEESGDVCEMSNGIIDPSTGACIISLDEQNNACVLNVETFDITCDPYCTNVASSQWLDVSGDTGPSPLAMASDEAPIKSSKVDSMYYAKEEDEEEEDSTSISVTINGAAQPVEGSATADELLAPEELETTMTSSMINNNTTIPFCGTASCQPSTTNNGGVECTASILFPSASNSEEEGSSGSEEGSSASILNITWTCDDTLECTCMESTWDGQPCDMCEYKSGFGPSYNCTSVGGPVGGSPPEEEGMDMSTTTTIENEEQQTNSTSSGNATTTDDDSSLVPRPYREDTNFVELIKKLSLPEASLMAGILIGGGVSDLEELKGYVPLHYTMIGLTSDTIQWNSVLKDSITSLSEYDFTKADDIVDYVKNLDNNEIVPILIRGTALISGTAIPETLVSQVDTSSTPDTTLIELMEHHMTVMAEHFSTNSDGDVGVDRTVQVWDVVNDHLTTRTDENIFYTVLGDDYVKLSFEMARGLFPFEEGVRLIWNENINVVDMQDEHIQLWLELLKQYKEDNVPIDGVGIQGHNVDHLHDLDVLRELCQAIVDLDYDIEFTAVDASITLFVDGEDDDPFERQGQYLADYAKVCLDTGRCKGVTFSGLSDKVTWMDDSFVETAPHLPVLIDEEGYEKPAWLYLREALEEYSASTNGGENVSEEEETITDSNATVSNTTEIINETDEEPSTNMTTTTTDGEEPTDNNILPSFSAAENHNMVLQSGATVFLLSIASLLAMLA